MFRRLLIANRGEVAQRILRACESLQIETVVVYSEADREAPWLEGAADESYGEIVSLGPETAPRLHAELSALLRRLDEGAPPPDRYESQSDTRTTSLPMWSPR